jgi:hypothetical protein
VLDASYYPSDIRIPGIEDTNEAYDALNSALAVKLLRNTRSSGLSRAIGLTPFPESWP